MEKCVTQKDKDGNFLNNYLPAFPSATQHYVQNIGMSLRDYFAAKAMQGMLSSWYSVGDNYEHNGLVSEKIISKESYKIADAMLKARELKEVQP